MAGKRGDKVRTEFYDPQIMGTLDYANNVPKNRRIRLERFYLNKLVQMSANRFTWKGLPDDISVRYLELALLYNGYAVFFKEREKYGQWMVLKAASMGPLNVYDEPVSYTVIGGSGDLIVNETLKRDECVPIWANYMRTPEFIDIRMWAEKLADIDVTIDLSFQNARQTKFISVPEDARLSAENVLKQMLEGVPAVFGTPELSQVIKAIETVDLESHPNKILNLLVSKAKIWNEIMTFMGVNNSNQDKRERLVADEVAANDEQIDLVKETFISTRKVAAKEMSEMCGQEITVEFNQSAAAMMEGADQGGASNAIPNQRDAATWNES